MIRDRDGRSRPGSGAVVALVGTTTAVVARRIAMSSLTKMEGRQSEQDLFGPAGVLTKLKVAAPQVAGAAMLRAPGISMAYSQP